MTRLDHPLADHPLIQSRIENNVDKEAQSPPTAERAGA
jgi:hypothetical protein